MSVREGFQLRCRFAPPFETEPWPPSTRLSAWHLDVRARRRALLADGRADVDHTFVLDRHEGRADAEDDALDLVE
jgi:hypothetical protein